MKTGRGIRKIPDGKLVKIEVLFDEVKKRIESIKITGDFFCYPENIIPEIELLFQNKKIPFKPADVETEIKDIEKIIEKGDLIGVSAKDIIEVIMEATN